MKKISRKKVYEIAGSIVVDKKNRKIIYKQLIEEAIKYNTLETNIS